MDKTGTKRFLKRTLDIDEIKALSATAHAAVLSGQDVVAITSSGFDGGNGSGELMVSAVEIGDICEEIIAEVEGDSIPRRSIFTRADMCYSTGGLN